MDNSRFRTRAVHAGHEVDPGTGAHAVPIYQTSTFGYGDADRGERLFAGKEQGYFYSRLGNPTVRAFEEKLASLEGTEDAVAFASGMGALSALSLTLLEPGNEVAFLGPLYGGSEGFFRHILAKFGVTVWEAENLQDLQARLTPRVRMVYVETPTNPTLRISDLREVARLAHRVGALAVADNTFSTPYLTRPAEHGVDMVLHSATKYLGGHGDAIGGVVTGHADLMAEIRVTGLRHVGASLGPQEAYLFLRGMKTLPLRMDAHCEGALQVARHFAQHPAIRRVFYPGLPDHEGHEVAARQMAQFGGMVSFDLRGGYDSAKIFLDHLQLFVQAVSLGDVESLSCHPASTTHQLLGAETLARQGVTPGLARLSVGIEDPADLIEDLERALEHVEAVAR
ncbi:trans-sulfuration enzyme family protein [Deinococcus peraridilitoris]|uniref:Cystathionine beta-lyase/cystathionine gamma-synthase n=1 Tax=Deinococcus peraridilitoris (strain DSM 19664 / LMG 22246 / CIP 109416 / KR-200) TaxID=937777 RepID=K9ZY80_DEIPD|nr:PLP-dependent aspartate aminotransferase family protein [Deinococcus peraridilitoris]AFZ66598.1 cystathionine beta-lyase/cystathionine gamma-synthase [Deinococcus peraridilitoris DSM 19664]